MKTYKVSQLHNEISNILKESYIFPISIEGEITSYRGANSSGHYYFNLKDDKASISCVLFKGKSFSCSILPEMGKKVKITGTVETYSNPSSSSKYQIIVSQIEDIGLGVLYQKYLKLLDDLGVEGLFNDEHKNQSFSRFPKTIGVITSDTGAVIHDIIETVTMRYPFAKIILYPSKVQGEDAAKDIICGLEYMEKNKEVETVILGRGGGSFEDLFCYNDENLVRYIYSMKTQVISSVGHDKDRPLCDFVADIRASTPTQAAMIVTPYTIDDINNDLEYYKENTLSSFDNFISKNTQNLDYYLESILKMFKNTIKINSNKLDSISNQIKLLSYSSILNRGFSITTDMSGNIIKSSKQVKSNDKIKTTLNKGELISTIN